MNVSIEEWVDELGQVWLTLGHWASGQFYPDKLLMLLG